MTSGCQRPTSSMPSAPVGAHSTVKSDTRQPGAHGTPDFWLIINDQHAGRGATLWTRRRLVARCMPFRKRSGRIGSHRIVTSGRWDWLLRGWAFQRGKVGVGATGRDGQGEDKGCSLPRLAFGPDAPTMRVDDVGADGKPQTGAGGRSRFCPGEADLLHAIKFIENGLQFGGRDADALVRDTHC